MSRQIPAKNSLTLSERDTRERETVQGKVLFTDYRGQECALLIRKDRLTAARVLSEMAGRIGAVYIGKNSVGAAWILLSGTAASGKASIP